MYEIALMEKKLECSHAELLKMVPVLITTLEAKVLGLRRKRNY